MIISADAWARLLAAGSLRGYEPMSVLLWQGASPRYVMALTAGRVKIVRTSCDGSVLVLAIRGPGEILGDVSLLGGVDRTATVIAVDRCEVRIVPAERFVRLVKSLGLESQLLQHAMSRMLEGEAWRAELSALPAGPRLVRTLARLATADPSAADIGLDQTELGQAAGLARSTVAAELARLRRRGLVNTARRRIIITDLPRLLALATQAERNV